jgi:hypothetical protein
MENRYTDHYAVFVAVQVVTTDHLMNREFPRYGEEVVYEADDVFVTPCREEAKRKAEELTSLVKEAEATCRLYIKYG